MNFICFGRRAKKKTEMKTTRGNVALSKCIFFGNIDAHFCANKIKAPPRHFRPYEPTALTDRGISNYQSWAGQ